MKATGLLCFAIAQLAALIPAQSLLSPQPALQSTDDPQHHVKTPTSLSAAKLLFTPDEISSEPTLQKRQFWNTDKGVCQPPNIFNGINVTIDYHKAPALPDILGCFQDLRAHGWWAERHRDMDWVRRFSCGWTATFFIDERDTSDALDCIEGCRNCMRLGIAAGGRAMECSTEIRPGRSCRMGFLPWPEKLEDYYHPGIPDK